MTDIRDIETDFTDLTDFESESEYTTQTDTLTDTHTDTHTETHNSESASDQVGEAQTSTLFGRGKKSSKRNETAGERGGVGEGSRNVQRETRGLDSPIYVQGRLQFRCACVRRECVLICTHKHTCKLRKEAHTRATDALYFYLSISDLCVHCT